MASSTKIFLVLALIALCTAPVSAAANKWDNGGPQLGTKGSGIITFSGVVLPDACWTINNATVYYWENSANGAQMQSQAITLTNDNWSGSLSLTSGTTYFIFVSVPQTSGATTQFICTQGQSVTAP